MSTNAASGTLSPVTAPDITRKGAGAVPLAVRLKTSMPVGEITISSLFVVSSASILTLLLVLFRYRLGTALPLANRSKTTSNPMPPPLLPTINSLFTRSITSPSGLLSKVLVPFIIRPGTTFPPVDLSKTKIVLEPPLATQMLAKDGVVVAGVVVTAVVIGIMVVLVVMVVAAAGHNAIPHGPLSCVCEPWMIWVGLRFPLPVLGNV